MTLLTALSARSMSPIGVPAGHPLREEPRRKGPQREREAQHGQRQPARKFLAEHSQGVDRQQRPLLD